MSAPVRKLVIALAVSAGLNLFLLGMLSVGLLHSKRSAHETRVEHPGRGPSLLFGAGEAFGGDHPRAERILREHKRELMSQRRETREARRRVQGALEAEPFSPEELERALEGLRTQTQHSQAALHRALVELAKEATPEQRRRLASWTEHRRRSRSKP